MFIVFAPVLLLSAIWYQKKWIVGLIPFLFLIRIIWLGLTNPEWVTHPGNDSFFLYLNLLLVLFAASQLKLIDYGHLFFGSLYFIGIVETIIGIWQLSIYVPNPTVPLKTAMVGTLGTSNGLGLLLVLSVISGSVLFKKASEKWIHISITAGLLFILLGIMLTESRGAVLALLVAGFLIGFILFYNAENSVTQVIKRYKIATGVTALILLIGVVYGLYTIDRASSEGRLMIWHISWDMFQEQPVTGVGHGNYAVKYLDYQADFLSEAEHVHLQDKAANLKQAHNEFFQAFAEGGIIGGIFFLLIWLLPFIYGLKYVLHANQKDWKFIGVIGIHAAILTHSLVDSPLHVFPVTLIGYINFMMIPMPEWQIKLTSFWKKLLIIVLVIFTCLMAFRAKRLYSARYALNQGLKFASQLEWEPAVIHYQLALNKFGKKGELEHYLGAAMVFNEQYTKGIYYLNQAKKDFNDRNIYLMESYANLKLKKYEEAEHLAKQALRMFPDHLAPHLLLGEIYYHLDEIEKSKSSLRKCITMETHIISHEVEQISRDAEAYWRNTYGENIDRRSQN